MTEVANIIRDTAERLLADHVDPAEVEGGWNEALWALIAENGLPAMLRDGELGWREAFAVVEACGRHALPLPLPEAIAAGWLLRAAGLEAPDGIVGLGCGTMADEVIRLERVPWGRRLDWVAATFDGRLALLPRSGATVTEGTSLAGEPRDTLVFPAKVAAFAPCAETGWRLGATLRAAQMAGAIAAVLKRTVDYAGERQQFGRAIGNFQAVQHLLAVLAEEGAAASMAAQQPFQALDGQGDVAFAVAVAKIRTGEAAGRVAAIAHQVHGAMGFAREHPLHLLTRRLWAWRAEFGAESLWAERLAAQVIPHGGEGLWPFLTAAQTGT